MSNLEPAFPRDHASDGHNGMSLRDYFAARAMQGICAKGIPNVSGDLFSWIANDAYRLADAMLKTREAKWQSSNQRGWLGDTGSAGPLGPHD